MLESQDFELMFGCFQLVILLLQRTAGLALPEALRRRFSQAMTRPARSSAKRFCSRLLVCGSPSRCSWFTICTRGQANKIACCFMSAF